MISRHLWRLASAVAATSVFVVACSGSAATNAPSQPAASAAPSLAVPSIVVPSLALPSIALPSVALPSVALPSGSFALPSFSFPSEDKDLENRLPSQINGVTLVKYSVKGTTFLASGSSNSQDLIDLLTALGKTPNDLSVAFAGDPSGGLDVQIGAFRVAGADSNALLTAFVAASQKSTPGQVVTQANVGGKNVTNIVDPADTSTSPTYVYGNGDVLFYVLTPDPALAATALQQLP